MFSVHFSVTHQNLCSRHHFITFHDSFIGLSVSITVIVTAFLVSSLTISFPCTEKKWLALWADTLFSYLGALPSVLIVSSTRYHGCEWGATLWTRTTERVDFFVLFLILKEKISVPFLWCMYIFFMSELGLSFVNMACLPNLSVVMSSWLWTHYTPAPFSQGLG